MKEARAALQGGSCPGTTDGSFWLLAVALLLPVSHRLWSRGLFFGKAVEVCGGPHDKVCPVPENVGQAGRAGLRAAGAQQELVWHSRAAVPTEMRPQL